MSQLEASPTERFDCQFCGYPISAVPVRTESGVPCCSEHCRDAFESGQNPFAGQFEFKRFRTGVQALDVLFPQGIPTNSFVLLQGDKGIRHRGLQTELVWRTLRRDEPAIIITFVDPAIAIVEHFLSFGWNVLPFLEDGTLQIIDCFTFSLRDEHQTPNYQSEWNDFLGRFLEGSVTTINETNNIRSMEGKLHTQLQNLDMIEQGIVIIDSLNEMQAQGLESEAEQFVKEVHADVCSRNFVPIFASSTNGNEGFPTERSYLFDGIIEMRRNESYLEGSQLKQLGVRKMDAVRYHPNWITYEHIPGHGFQMFDPDYEFTTIYGMLTRQPSQQYHPTGPHM